MNQSTLYKVVVAIGGALTAWYFDLADQRQLAVEHVKTAGVEIVEDVTIDESTLPAGEMITDAAEMKNWLEEQFAPSEDEAEA